MRRGVSVLLATTILLLLGTLARAAEQQSENYRIEGAGIQNGVGGAAIELGSTAFGITLSTVGDPVTSDVPLARPGLEALTGFTSSFSPPAEVSGLAFTGSATLAWVPARSADSYTVYRGTLDALPAAYGHCLQADVPATTAFDPSDPVAGTGYFYLVTATNSLDEESASGFDSGSSPRTPTACP